MKVGVALSGGAVRGLAHIGILKALDEYGFKPDIISGVSAGSIVGLFYVSGYNPSEMEKIALKTDISDYIRPSFSKKSLFNIEKLDYFIEKYISQKDLSELKIPFYVAVTNLNTASVEYKNTGDIKKIIRASCSLPILFKPVKIDNYLYVDGGVMNNLPVEPFIEKVDFVIGAEVNPFLKEERDFSNIVSIAVRSFYLAIRSNIESRRPFCNLFIQPPKLTEVPLFATWKKEEAIQIGYEYTRYVLKNLNLT